MVTRPWLSYLNNVDLSATTIKGDSQVTTRPVTNLAKRDTFADFFRSESNEVVIDFDFGSDQSSQALALYFGRYDTIARRGQFLSLSDTDTVRWKLDADGGTLGTGAAYDSTAIASGVNAGYGYHGRFLADAVTHRYARVILTGTSRNTPETDFLDVARAWMGPVFRFDHNFAVGHEYKWVSGANVSSAELLPSERVDKGARYRSYQIAFQYLPQADRDALVEFERLAGDDEQFLFSLSDDNADLATQMMLCRVMQASGIQSSGFVYFNKSLGLRESL